jgi:hypothetical protein
VVSELVLVQSHSSCYTYTERYTRVATYVTLCTGKKLCKSGSDSGIELGTTQCTWRLSHTAVMRVGKNGSYMSCGNLGPTFRLYAFLPPPIYTRARHKILAGKEELKQGTANSRKSSVSDHQRFRSSSQIPRIRIFLLLRQDLNRQIFQ